MTISRALQEQLRSSSWIRKMFETGEALRQRLGENNVFDLSLGSPILEPPPAFQEALREIVASDVPGLHRYMPNAGFLSTRQAVAAYLGQQEQEEIAADDITMTVGAAGAMNVALASILDPGDEVIIFAPYFVEYLFYTTHHGGVTRIVETNEEFDLDIEAIERTITPRTKALIINTPNNPTGTIYSQSRLAELALVLDRCEKRLSRTIYLIVDTPYARLTYDGATNPLLLRDHPSTLVAHSFSKDMGLAGERIGFLATSPRAPHREALRGAFAVTNRTLGYVNAPALMQRAVERSLGAHVNVDHYRGLRDLLYDGLTEAGFSFARPQGAFYLFPPTPIADDLAFSEELARENILVVPGSGFGRKGHIRVAFCVPRQTIEGALPGLTRVMERYGA